MLGGDCEGASFGDSGTHGRLSLSDQFRELGALSLSSRARPHGPSIADRASPHVDYLGTIRAYCL